MSIIGIVCFGIFTLFFLTLFKKGTDVFSPSRLFILIWSLAIGLAELKLSRFQIYWTGYSWLMIIISIGSLLLGFFIIYVINLNRPMLKIPEIRKMINTSKINSSRLFNYTVILFIAYLVSYIVSALVIGFVPVFTKYPGLTRNDWGIFGFGLLVQAFPAVIYLVVLFFITTKAETRKKFILASVLIVTFVTYALLLQRYYVLLAIVLSAVALYYCTNLFKPRNIFFIVIIFLVIFFGMSVIRLTGTILDYLYYLSDMRYSVKYAMFTEPYMYVVMNLENFANAVDKLQNHTYGLFSFDFVFALTGLKHQMFKYLELVEFPHMITNNYNTYTMFFIYYWDFGVIGLAAVPLFLGMIFSNAYYKMRINPNINTISLYAIFNFVILMSFFIPIVTFLHFVFNLFVIHFITKKALLVQSS